MLAWDTECNIGDKWRWTPTNVIHATCIMTHDLLKLLAIISSQELNLLLSYLAITLCSLNRQDTLKIPKIPRLQWYSTGLRWQVSLHMPYD